MQKLIAILNVVAWSGFWAFGYLALTAETDHHMMVAFFLAVGGAGLGLWAYLRLVRYCEAIGYARKPNRAVKPEDEIA